MVGGRWCAPPGWGAQANGPRRPDAGTRLRLLAGGRRLAVVLLLELPDTAPFLVLGHRHAALDADARPLTGFFLLPKQFLENAHGPLRSNDRTGGQGARIRYGVRRILGRPGSLAAGKKLRPGDRAKAGQATTGQARASSSGRGPG